jgi:hypothetical protein
LIDAGSSTAPTLEMGSIFLSKITRQEGHLCTMFPCHRSIARRQTTHACRTLSTKLVEPRENASAEHKTIPTLEQVANPTHKIYRTSKIEEAKPNILETIEAQQEDQLRQIEDEAEVEALESQNEAEVDFDFEVFEGENTRGYVGLLPLADMEVVNPKRMIKQGSLIEIRGYHSIPTHFDVENLP